MFTPVESDGILYQDVVNQIENLINTAKLKPGEKLPSERELTKSFGVSRTVIREAIKALEQRGYVKVQQGKGVFIIPLKQEHVTESIHRILGQKKTTMAHLLEAREALESEIIILAAERVTAEQLKELRNSVNLMDRSMNDVLSYTLHDQQFHITLAEATQNPIYLLFLNSILHMIQHKRMRIFLSDPHQLVKSQEQHKKLLEALHEHDPIKARQVMDDHMEMARQAIEPIKHLEVPFYN